MRGLPRRFVTFLLLGAFLSLPVIRAWGAPRSPATRSAGGNILTLRGLEYLSVTEFARRFDLKTAWLTPGKRMVLTKPGFRVELEADTREAKFDGLRILMGDAARMYRRSLYISRIDAESFLGPMIAPDHKRSGKRLVKTIALDAGHGGKDTGMTNALLKVNEKTFALDVVLRLRKLLSSAGYRVVLTRADDRFVELEDRPAIAQKAGADLFISVHFNSVAQRPASVTGVEVFTMTPQYQYSTDDSLREATADARIFNPGNTNDTLNAFLGYSLHRELHSGLKPVDRGHKRARFKVLRLALCPAVLVEAGYLSNNTEARKIASPAYRQAIADSIARGIQNYVKAVTEG